VRALARIGLLVALGCGDGAAAGGGSEHLPTLGAGPYAKLPLRLVADATADLGDPTTHEGPDGLRLWFTRTPTGETASAIWTALLTSFDEPATDLRPALVADQAWEGDSLRAPSVIELPDGRLALYYQGGPSTIGRALSSDGGATWQKGGPVLDGATDPAVLFFESDITIYHGRPGEAGIWRDGSPDPVLPGVSEPGVVGGRTAAGQVQIGLFYVQPAEGGLLAIGYAGSRDGIAFEPFFEGQPVLDPDSPDERGPEAHLHPDQGFLVFGERRGSTQVIGGAVHP
jgi:hypothetical protein